MSSANDMSYSEKYSDNKYEYRHVTIPKELVKRLPKRLMTEDEWRRFGVQQSRGIKLDYMIDMIDCMCLITVKKQLS